MIHHVSNRLHELISRGSAGRPPLSERVMRPEVFLRHTLRSPPICTAARDDLGLEGKRRILAVDPGLVENVSFASLACQVLLLLRYYVMNTSRLDESCYVV